MAKQHHGMSPENRFSATNGGDALLEFVSSTSKSPDVPAEHEQLMCQLSDGGSQCGKLTNYQDAWNSETAALETVSDATHGFDESPIIAQFLAKSHNLTIDGAICGRVIRPLNGLDDLLARIRITGMAGQKIQQSKLCLCQRKWPAFNEAFIGR